MHREREGKGSEGRPTCSRPLSSACIRELITCPKSHPLGTQATAGQTASGLSRPRACAQTGSGETPLDPSRKCQLGLGGEEGVSQVQAPSLSPTYDVTTARQTQTQTQTPVAMPSARAPKFGNNRQSVIDWRLGVSCGLSAAERDREQETFSVHLMAGAVSAPSWTAPVCRRSLLDWGAGKHPASSRSTPQARSPGRMGCRARWELGSLPTGLAWFVRQRDGAVNAATEPGSTFTVCISYHVYVRSTVYKAAFRRLIALFSHPD